MEIDEFYQYHSLVIVFLEKIPSIYGNKIKKIYKLKNTDFLKVINISLDFSEVLDSYTIVKENEYILNNNETIYSYNDLLEKLSLVKNNQIIL